MIGGVQQLPANWSGFLKLEWVPNSMLRRVQSRRDQHVICEHVSLVLCDPVAKPRLGATPPEISPTGTTGEVSQDTVRFEHVTHDYLKRATTEQPFVKVHAGPVVDVTHDQELPLLILPVVDPTPDRVRLGE